MAQRKVSIQDKAVDEVASVAYFIEGKGLPATAKNLLMQRLNFLIRWATIQ